MLSGFATEIFGFIIRGTNFAQGKLKLFEMFSKKTLTCTKWIIG